MVGYIYHITNLETGKKYIGKAVDIKRRISREFHDLRKGIHNSIKLQRSFTIHGEDKFKVTYQEIEVEDEQELYLKEIEEIDKYNSYENGYNMTRGGEGNISTFDFKTSVLLYQIGQRYDGVGRKIARYYNCDKSTVYDVFRRDFLQKIEYDENELQALIKKLNITDDNLIENYHNNYSRQLTEEQAFEVLNILEHQGQKSLQGVCAEIFNVKKDIISSMVRGITYKADVAAYNEFTQKERDEMWDIIKEKYPIDEIYYRHKRGPVKNPLTQEQIDYILDNINTKTGSQIARELNISSDRVLGVKNRKSYIDMIINYEKRHS